VRKSAFPGEHEIHADSAWPVRKLFCEDIAAGFRPSHAESAWIKEGAGLR